MTLSFAPGGADALQKALDRVAEAGGGAVVVGPGRYASGSVVMRSGVELRVEAGARIDFFCDPESDETVETEFEGVVLACARPLIYARDAKNLRVTGEGILTGGGAVWWELVRAGRLRRPRPRFLLFERCEDVLVRGVTLMDSPCWTVHPLNCRGVVVENVRIVNPADAPNTDGINPDGSRDVTIADCEIDVGDDCVAIKAGTRACEGIRVIGCRMLGGHGGVVLGSETSGGIRDVVIENCAFFGTDRGIRIKTRRGRGGGVEKVVARNLEMDGVACPIVLNMRYFCGAGGHSPSVRDDRALPVNQWTPHIRDIEIKNVRARNVTGCALFALGIPEARPAGIRVEDFDAELLPGRPFVPAMADGVSEMEAEGFSIRDADIQMKNARAARAKP